MNPVLCCNRTVGCHKAMERDGSNCYTGVPSCPQYTKKKKEISK